MGEISWGSTRKAAWVLRKWPLPERGVLLPASTPVIPRPPEQHPCLIQR